MHVFIKLPGKQKYLIYTKILPWPASNTPTYFDDNILNLLPHSLTFPECKIGQKGSLLLAICAHYVTNYFTQRVSMRDLPEQIQGAADHSGAYQKACTQCWRLTSVMLIHTFSGTELAQILVVRINTKREKITILLFQHFIFLPLCVNREYRLTFIYGSHFVFFHSYNALEPVYFSTWPRAQQTDVCLINEFIFSALPQGNEVLLLSQPPLLLV